MANSNRIIEHFSQVKSERMGIDLQVIKYHRLNLDEVLYGKIDYLRRQMINNGLSDKQINRLKAFRKRERSKLHKKGEMLNLGEDLVSLQNLRDSLINERRELKEEIAKYQEMDNKAFLEELTNPYTLNTFYYP
eukprot:TRINITY_DN23494_c0_g1_i1.p1 TRINITY_DN23494_c0_g1~~TRINITY_DN23494_c0_g1_i1.p1  ORF type:complete len:142 (-),score=24.47 TRINITY_DN23494_c0_g1_i1:124-525(-)